MKKKNLKSIISIFSMLICFSVFAQGPPGGGQGGRGGKGGQEREKPDASEILSKLDSNKDNRIDKEEAAKDQRGKIAEDFEEIDTNSDAFIDLEELEDALNDRKKPKKIDPEKLIKQIDDDGNGMLNELEVAAKGKRDLSEKFNEIDTNEDAELDIEELKSFFDDSTDDNKSKRKKRD
ncbi:EF-hand domain-containing protein [Lacinutrix gracilariae]|uniref:EF-hand domain-containing protein n=1 Tax=Lacinutrix gracilariae TaxID=1747198 RepID=A0ABW5JYD6_9FLAO